MSIVYDESHIGRRVVYSGRNGNSRAGVLRGIIPVGNGQFLDLKLDGSNREHFSVPSDTVVLVPDELSDTV